MSIPSFVPLIFILTTGLTLYLFLKASNTYKLATLLLLGWLVLNGILAYTGFYQNMESLPPRMGIAIIPPVLFFIGLFFNAKGKKWIARLDLKTLTILHTVRIPVELVLYWLFLGELVPELMTFSGRNFDILAGITAPMIYYFGFVKNRISRKVILVWNVICLLLLLNIIINALLSAPFPFQQFGFDRPNIALVIFPYIWLPSVVVPIVLFSHLVAIQRLTTKNPEH